MSTDGAPAGRSLTVPTGGGVGAYVIVLPATTSTCTVAAGVEQSCVGGGGYTTSGPLQSGVVTAVRYRDGHVCRLPNPTRSGTPRGSCPGVGFRPHPFQPPHITANQVRTHASAEARVRGHQLDIRVRFTARLAASNAHSVYEWSLGRVRGPACAVTGGGMSATTMTPIRPGEHVVLRDGEFACRGAYRGLVTYQPNGWPGRDTLDWNAPIRDGSVLVGRFSFVVK